MITDENLLKAAEVCMWYQEVFDEKVEVLADILSWAPALRTGTTST